MKKLMYLFVVATIVTFTSCGGTATKEAATEKDVVLCGDDCQKSCCLGCKATEGNKRCIILEDGSMPCCI